MKKNRFFIFAFLSFATRVCALEITKKVEVTPHLQLVKFEDPIAYIIEDNDTNSKAVRTLAPFAMNRFETTYGLWYDCITQSQELGYYFENPGRGGSHGKKGLPPTRDDLYLPVANITWYDAVVWCNAYSELQGREPCYTYNGEIIKDSRDREALNNCHCNFSANGFRLPTEAEWEYAARHCENGFQWGNLISGQLNEDVDPLLYSWTYKNAKTTKIVGTTGSFIGKKGSGKPNGAGIYDMSGNVMEFCWDWYDNYDTDLPYGPDSGTKKVTRGGSWSPHNMQFQADDRYAVDPEIIYPYSGFRIVCSLVD